jgi:biopolymer transport protein ExbB
MNALLDLYAKGGPVMIAIAGLSVVLYASCFQLLLRLRQDRRWMNAHLAHLPALRRRIAAAPLLGLLGTVSGMIKTFESLADRVGQKSMEGLAQGISQVLVATESGLAVALPALLLVYLAHRAVRRNLQQLHRLEDGRREGHPA